MTASRRRARATALALVNWKGVFYERYSLDPHVTALEGANGSGKTTVMVAAYVVLMPDLTRLRFSNVGESSGAGGDKGLFGRLGEAGRPSYAALEVEIEDGKRLVLGVCLERRTEPAVDLTPFLVSGLALHGSLKQILLGSEAEEDVVPTLPDVRAAVTRLGGQLEVFTSAKDYFTTLFDHGITPLRLASDEDRAKLNEMLRTSMTGGISRALTGELRSFLLREEPGLGETLTHMRANLDACHRTRTEVAEARVLERELSAVYEAAKTTLDATLAAARAAAHGADQAAAAANAAAAEARRISEGQRQETAALAAELEVTRAQLGDARAEEERASSTLERTTRAREASLRIRVAKAELALREVTAGEAATSLESTVAARAERRATRDRAREAYDRAARGLADLQAGLSDLHVSAQAARRAREALAEANALLGLPVDPANAERVRGETRARLATIDERRVHVERDLATADRRRDERTRALGALERLAPSAPGDAYTVARAELARLADADERRLRLPELAERAAHARSLALRQADVLARARAAEPELAKLTPGASAQLEAGRLALEARFTEAEARAGREAVRAIALEHARAAAASRLAAITLAASRYAAARKLADELAETLATSGVGVGAAPRTFVTQADGGLARAQLDEQRARCRDERAALGARREALRREIESIERHAGGSQDPELLRLRDELDGELLALRFEDLEVEEAARKEAALGPLVNALVVDSPEHALRAILGKPRDLTTLFLVRPDAEVGAQTIVGEAQGDVVVAEPYGFRITRIEREPRLGARARQRRVHGLREQESALTDSIAALDERTARLERARASLDTLFVDLAVLEAGPPTDELAQATALDARTREELETSSGALAEARRVVHELRPKVEALRALASESLLLEPPDYAALSAELEAELAAARRDGALGPREAEARQTLAALVHALAEPEPPEAEALRAERAQLEGERDRLFRAERALDAAIDAALHVLHADAETMLAARAEVVPALEAAHTAAREAATLADTRLGEAEATWELATRAAQDAELAHKAARSELARAVADLEREGIGEVDDDAVATAQAELARARGAAAELEARVREAALDHAVKTERAVTAERVLDARLRDVVRESERLRPARELHDELVQASERAGIRWPEPRTDGDHAALYAQARGVGEVLTDRLGRARAGAELASTIRERLLTPDAESFARSAITTWEEVVAWLKRRLPLAISALADPTAALLRLRDDLASLESRLGHQEGELRGASEDVARGIDVQLRRAKSQVRRLNQTLAGVSFGSILGIRIQMTRVERMDQVLSALREGKSQDLLFDPRLPVEEALAEIFKRHAGGKAGSQRILDYREYLELSVDVQRAGKTEWETASPARLSTGEGIGVGAAILMVVLTEWERDSNLLRTRRPVGSLRFLFLDEANRLSQDNLAVLFDLCQTLELQLLIAAPEVARADGNTTYRLVRRTDEAGREEVVVSGRRALRETELT